MALRHSNVDNVRAPEQAGNGATDISDATFKSAARAPLRKRGKGRAAESKLHAFHTLPDYLADNEFIREYYRADYSVRESVQSLFRLHNETGNIWSHLLGFLLFGFLTILVLRSQPAPLKLGTDRLAQLEHHLYEQGRSSLQGMLRAEKNFEHRLWLAGERLEKLLVDHGKEGIEALWRLEERMAKVGNQKLAELSHYKDEKLHQLAELEERLKTYGTAGMTGAKKELHDLEQRLMRGVAGLLNVEWPAPRWPLYVFLSGCMFCLLSSSVCHLLGCCQAHVVQWVWRVDYAGIVVLIVTSFVPPLYYGFMCNPNLRLFYLVTTVTLGSMVTAVCLLSFFQQVQFRVFRASLFAALGMWGVVPAGHILITSWGKPAVMNAVSHAMVMGLIYILGAIIYASRVPERWKPGFFDIWMHSHQLFHICVIAAAFVHYKGIRLMLDWRDSVGGCDVTVTSWLGA
eukprot:jgi/Botrbrau1/16676/Bobra.0068s0092.1